MKQIHKLIGIMASKKYYKLVILAFLFTVFLIENQWFGQEHLKMITGGLKMIDMNFFNDISDITQYLTIINEAGRDAYTLLLGIDILLVFTFFFLQAALITRLINWLNLGEQFRFLIFFPFIRGLFDLMENIAMLYNTIMFPNSPVITLSIASFSTIIKWCFFWATMAVIIVLSGIYLRQRILKKICNKKKLILKEKI